MIRDTFLICALAVNAVCAAAADDVQRQLQQREQSQTELRLKMQQQRDRAAQPPQTLGEDLQRRVLDRAQQQRLEQLQDRQARDAISPAPAAGDMHREMERQRLPQASSEELKRYERERQIGVERRREVSEGHGLPTCGQPCLLVPSVRLPGDRARPAE
jgi:hypothetical protein